MRKLARTCLPNTFTSLPKGKPPVISDGCPWQQLKQIHQSKEKGKKGQSGELVFAPGGNLGVLNLSSCQAQVPSRSCLAQDVCSSVAKSSKGEEAGLSPGRWRSLPGA